MTANNARTLLHPPTDYNGNTLLASGIKLFVFETVRSSNRLCQVIVTSNNFRKTIFIRLSFNGSFENSEWASFVPSNNYYLKDQDFINVIDKLGHNITLQPYDNIINKVNAMTMVSVSFTANENINGYTDILTVPKKVLNLDHNVNTLLVSEQRTIVAYWHSIDENYVSLRARSNLISGETYYTSSMIVNYQVDNL